MADQTANLLRELPSIDYLLKHSRCEALLARYNREYVIRHCRAVIDQMRLEIRQGRGGSIDLGEASILDRIENRIFLDSRPGHRCVVNATGTVLHTNLGRALLSQAAIDAMVEVADHPINLEFDLSAGKRGKREETLESLLVGVPRTDPLSFGASVAVLAIVAVLAHLVPALRALRVDPAIALRAD